MARLCTFPFSPILRIWRPSTLLCSESAVRSNFMTMTQPGSPPCRFSSMAMARFRDRCAFPLSSRSATTCAFAPKHAVMVRKRLVLLSAVAVSALCASASPHSLPLVNQVMTKTFSIKKKPSTFHLQDKHVAFTSSPMCSNVFPAMNLFAVWL
jgi:hypothetical protein